MQYLLDRYIYICTCTCTVLFGWLCFRQWWSPPPFGLGLTSFVSGRGWALCRDFACIQQRAQFCVFPHLPPLWGSLPFGNVMYSRWWAFLCSGVGLFYVTVVGFGWGLASGFVLVPGLLEWFSGFVGWGRAGGVAGDSVTRLSETFSTRHSEGLIIFFVIDVVLWMLSCCYFYEHCGENNTCSVLFHFTELVIYRNVQHPKRISTYGSFFCPFCAIENLKMPSGNAECLPLAFVIL